MMNKIIVFFLLVCVGCRSDQKVPGGVLEVNKMKMVMWDMLQAEEYVDNFLLKDSGKDRKTETLKMYAKVFSRHDISKETYTESYAYYKTHPVVEKILIDSLQSYAAAMKDKDYQRLQINFTIPMNPVADTVAAVKDPLRADTVKPDIVIKDTLRKDSTRTFKKKLRKLKPARRNQ